MGLRVGRKCAASGKKKYGSESDALIAFSSHPRMMRVYRCPDCGYWHGSRKYAQDAA